MAAEMTTWCSGSASPHPQNFFLSSDVEKVVTAFTKVMRWVKDQQLYREEAKTRFAKGADGWLVAHGMASGKTTVTNEQSRPDSRNQIKLPDVCNSHSVAFEDTFAMLHKLSVRYRFLPNG